MGSNVSKSITLGLSVSVPLEQFLHVERGLEAFDVASVLVPGLVC